MQRASLGPSGRCSTVLGKVFRTANHRVDGIRFGQYFPTAPSNLRRYYAKDRPFTEVKSSLPELNRTILNSQEWINRNRTGKELTKDSIATRDQIRRIVTNYCLTSGDTNVAMKASRATFFFTYVYHWFEGDVLPSGPPFAEILKAEGVDLDKEFVVTLSLVILRELGQSYTAWFTLASAALLGDETAALFILATDWHAKKTVKLRSLAIPHAKKILLDMLARNHDEVDRLAILLYVKVMGLDRDTKAAIKLYERAFKAETYERPPVVQAILNGLIPHPWEELTRLKRLIGDEDGARQVTETAAVEQQQPRAQFEFAERYLNYDSEERRDCLLEAASAGHAPAAKELGIWYIRQSAINPANGALRQFLKKTAGWKMQDKNSKMGLEWLDVAGSLGSTQCKVWSAFVLRASGEREFALARLAEARKDPLWTAEIERAIAIWDQPGDDTFKASLLFIGLWESEREELINKAKHGLSAAEVRRISERY